jgi:hypothetical protein
LDPSQAIGEALAGDTIDNINTLKESFVKVNDARQAMYKPITLECE